MEHVKQVAENRITRGLIFILAVACGGIVANLYYAQTLIPLMGNYLQLNHTAASFIVTLTQIGYGVGLLFIVPLSDLIENRSLIVGLLCATVLFLLGIIFSKISIVFLLFCFLLGLTAVSAQVIVPFAAHLSPLESRGKTVGNIMSGLLLGIMLARPVASWLADFFSWQAVFIFSAIFMLILAITLYCVLPRRVPSHQLSYRRLLYSIPTILKSYPILQRRAIYHAVLFGVFSLFWTSIATLLMSKAYHYSQAQIALFAFCGAAGALVAPFAGRIADKGQTRPATAVAILIVAISYAIAKWYGAHSIIALLFSALLLDIGVSCNLVLGQRAIYALAPEIRGRLNGLYMAIFFGGGAIGSALAGYLYTQGGWNEVATMGLVASLVVLIYFLTEYINQRQTKNSVSKT